MNIGEDFFNRLSSNLLGLEGFRAQPEVFKLKKCYFFSHKNTRRKAA